MCLPGEAAGLESRYLEARYSCEALRIRLRRSGRGEAADRLKRAMTLLCAELRRLLAEEGRDRVGSVFPRELLDQPLGALAERCRSAAERLAGEGSRAAGMILEALEALPLPEAAEEPEGL